MSEPAPEVVSRASELRREFDCSFAEAPHAGEAQLENFLSIVVGADSYAIHLADVSGLFADKSITRLPTAIPEFLGIAGFRGVVLPVFDLRVLLGYSTKDVPRWLVIAAAAPVALAFDAFDRHLRLPREAVAREDHAGQTRQHLRAALRAPDLARPIVDVASILETIKRRTHPGAPK